MAALAEIGGAWLVWRGWREHRGLWWIAAGVLALGAYGFVAAFQPDAHFGRILAAYGGVFVAGSLAWGVVVDKFRPDRWDLDAWNAALVAVAVFMVIVAGADAALPVVDEVPADFSAIMLWRFRLASLGTQLVLWTTLGPPPTKVPPAADSPPLPTTPHSPARPAASPTQLAGRLSGLVVADAGPEQVDTASGQGRVPWRRVLPSARFLSS